MVWFPHTSVRIHGRHNASISIHRRRQTPEWLEYSVEYPVYRHILKHQITLLSRIQRGISCISPHIEASNHPVVSEYSVEYPAYRHILKHQITLFSQYLKLSLGHVHIDHLTKHLGVSIISVKFMLLFRLSNKKVAHTPKPPISSRKGKIAVAGG